MNRNRDFNRIVFHSKEDGARITHLKRGEVILKDPNSSRATDINDILELYNLKKYIDNDVFRGNWTTDDIIHFKEKAAEFGKAVGRFMSNINDGNILEIHSKVLMNYIDSFWELVANQQTFKRISKDNFSTLLLGQSNLIQKILTHKNLVIKFDIEIREFLLNYPKAAIILLDVYELSGDSKPNDRIIPKSLTIEDKENIVSKYLDSEDVNLNYLAAIQNIRASKSFIISDKTRLKARRRYKLESDKIFASGEGIKFGVSVAFLEGPSPVKELNIGKDYTENYSYSFEYIKQNKDFYSLFRNFKNLFEYLDHCNRVELVGKKSQRSTWEDLLVSRSKSEYPLGTKFISAEMRSYAQITGYNNILGTIESSIEEILYNIFTTIFHEKYGFAENARFSIPTATSYLEKVRLLAPEFESALKQYRLFVQEGRIDFELLEISSSPSTLDNIPSLNEKKYLYLNGKNEVATNLSYLLFSDQTLLSYVDPFKEKEYSTLFDLIVNEEVKFSNYESYQQSNLNYLIKCELLFVDKRDFLQIANFERLFILKDLEVFEVGSFHHYPERFQKEAEKMEAENIIHFESSLFTKPEQAYFNYFLNKREFTNGMDLRNRYLHGTQASPDKIDQHERAYFTYLKLVVLAFLKIEDDLAISVRIKNKQ